MGKYMKGTKNPEGADRGRGDTWVALQLRVYSPLSWSPFAFFVEIRVIRDPPLLPDIHHILKYFLPPLW